MGSIALVSTSPAAVRRCFSRPYLSRSKLRLSVSLSTRNMVLAGKVVLLLTLLFCVSGTLVSCRSVAQRSSDDGAVEIARERRFLWLLIPGLVGNMVMGKKEGKYETDEVAVTYGRKVFLKKMR